MVDDEVRLRRTMRRLLEGKGHEVVEAGDGVEALIALERHAVDLAITDLMMPRMDGLELLRRMEQGFPGTRTVVISAVGEIIDLAEREPNVVGTLTKPFELSELAEAVRNALR